MNASFEMLHTHLKWRDEIDLEQLKSQTPNEILGCNEREVSLFLSFLLLSFLSEKVVCARECWTFQPPFLEKITLSSLKGF